MTKIKPLQIMEQEGLSDLEVDAVINGASELVMLAGVKINIINLGVWRNNPYKDRKGSLIPYQSVDWYVEVGKDRSRSRDQLNADAMQLQLLTEPWRNYREGGYDHYDIFIVKDDIYSHGTNFVIGVAQEGIGTTISTARFIKLKERLKYECIKTEIMHEIGHVFGLPSNKRTKNIEVSLGKHCTNQCVMRQGLILPDDWIRITKDRLRYSALCGNCEKDLREYFKD